MDPIAPNVTKDLWSQSNDILYSRGMKIFLLHYITNFVGRLFHSFILVTLIVRCDYLEICVEHHDFLRGDEEINLRAWLGLALGCLQTSTHSRRKRDCFDPETD